MVVTGPIKQYVKVAGQVQSSKDANLAFQSTGAASYVTVRPGDKVLQGKVLATLQSGDFQAALLQAEANLANVTSLLNQLQQAARTEELTLKEQTLQNAKDLLEQSYGFIPDSIQNVDAVTADVIKNKFSALFVFSNSRYLLSFSSCDQRLQSEIETKRTDLENTLAFFQKKSGVITAISSAQTIDKTFNLSYQATIVTNDLVNSISNLLLLPCSISNPSLDGYRSSLSLAKTSMTSLFSDIASKRSFLIDAKNAFNQALGAVNFAKAGTDPHRIKAQIALVSQAEARVMSARSDIQKTMIVAPFTGVIKSVDISTGEKVSAGKTVISMLAADSFEIEAKVSEVDIVKVKQGAVAEVTLDVYGQSATFPATVTRINSTTTTEGSVPVYKIIITFNGKDDRIKQGMTANIKIITESKSKAIIVPARFVKVLSSKEGQVTISSLSQNIVRDVMLGIRGEDGYLEITEGLFPGDILVSPTTVRRESQKNN